MAELFHWFGSDLAFGPTGDLALVNEPVRTEQRILRRLLTNAGDYLFQLAYGAGLGRYVGEPTNVLALTALIRSQIFMEASVAHTPAPDIHVTLNRGTGTVTATIRYADASSGAIQVLTFALPA